MSIQGFGPISGAAYKPPVRGNKIHTIADFKSTAKNNDGINQLAQRVTELRQEQENLANTTQQETESLRDLSAQLDDIHQDSNKLVEKLEKELERLKEDRVVSLKNLKKIEEENKRLEQTRESFRKDGGVIHCVFAFASELKKQIYWVAQGVYTIFQAIFGCLSSCSHINK